MDALNGATQSKSEGDTKGEPVPVSERQPRAATGVSGDDERPNMMAQAMLRHEQASNRIHNKTGAARRQ